MAPMHLLSFLSSPLYVSFFISHQLKAFLAPAFSEIEKGNEILLSREFECIRKAQEAVKASGGGGCGI
jgi:hypothetical protein